MGQACNSASCRSCPLSRIWLVKSTSMIEFFLAMPMSRIMPSMLYTFRLCPPSHSTSRAPDTLKGKASKTVNGCVKALNCAASTMYATTMPSTKAKASELNESWKACVDPDGMAE